ncbi:hypothetical protein [uncultured Adlercreutzia sp.]|uniref:hypothetical protein n=1 Tax=uncultured Adlercreutzia sp. TaxID=875803 RepID=UPI0026F3FDC2|nr:hypothetical protein [uncultured Adlercreutzia sp.]
MLSRFVSKTSILASAIACLAVLGVFATMLNAQSAEGDTPQSLREELYPCNVAGMTYGNVSDAPSGELEPDLIEAVATNGKEGYVKRAELDLATRKYENPLDSEKFQRQCEEKAVELMQQELSARNGRGEISAEVASCIIEGAMEWENEQQMLADISTQRSVDPVATQLSLEDCLESYLAVDEAMTIYIPVYEQDGTTEIGRFPVSLL